MPPGPAPATARRYVVIRLRDKACAEAAKRAINSYRPPEGADPRTRVIADDIPNTSTTGGGKACSVTELLDCMCRVLGIDKKDVLEDEFPAFVDLELSLHLKTEELLPHFHRIMSTLDLNPVEFMGPDNLSMFEAERLAQYSVIQELQQEGASPSELAHLRETLHEHGQERRSLVPWLDEDEDDAEAI
mmetsp:Transcript_7036/g.16150  ORF Transcript_7036/g.16150 Transcript_7036/m.16150 type:complete len:188 (+) Transcript_7036:1-564(+)